MARTLRDKLERCQAHCRTLHARIERLEYQVELQEKVKAREVTRLRNLIHAYDSTGGLRRALAMSDYSAANPGKRLCSHCANREAVLGCCCQECLDRDVPRKPKGGNDERCRAG